MTFPEVEKYLSSFGLNRKKCLFMAMTNTNLHQYRTEHCGLDVVTDPHLYGVHLVVFQPEGRHPVTTERADQFKYYIDKFVCVGTRSDWDDHPNGRIFSLAYQSSDMEPLLLIIQFGKDSNGWQSILGEHHVPGPAGTMHGQLFRDVLAGFPRSAVSDWWEDIGQFEFPLVTFGVR